MDPFSTDCLKESYSISQSRGLTAFKVNLRSRLRTRIIQKMDKNQLIFNCQVLHRWILGNLNDTIERADGSDEGCEGRGFIAALNKSQPPSILSSSSSSSSPHCKLHCVFLLSMSSQRAAVSCCSAAAALAVTSAQQSCRVGFTQEHSSTDPNPFQILCSCRSVRCVCVCVS